LSFKPYVLIIFIVFHEKRKKDLKIAIKMKKKRENIEKQNKREQKKRKKEKRKK